VRLSWKQAALWIAGLALTLISYGAQQVWADVRTHGDEIQQLKAGQALIPEIRDDVKEIRDAVRRLEGAADARRSP